MTWCVRRDATSIRRAAEFCARFRILEGSGAVRVEERDKMGREDRSKRNEMGRERRSKRNETARERRSDRNDAADMEKGWS